jgi:hypothetical protein
MMNSCIRALIVASVGSLLIAASASANKSQPQSPLTKQLAGVPCSVTASFKFSNSAGTMTYGGGVSCAGNIGQKTLNVVPQVFNLVNDQPLWFNISLVGLYQGPSPISPLRLTGTTTYVPSHVYRLLVYGRVTLPDGRTASDTVCTGGCVDSPALSINPSYHYQGAPPTSAPVSGVPCSVGQNGLDFTLVNGSYVLNYGGYTFCGGAGNVGTRSLTICAQVVNRINGKNVWFTVTGSCLSRNPTSSNPVFVNTARTAYLGHGYRVMASTTIKYPTAHGTVTSTATTYSAGAAP